MVKVLHVCQVDVFNNKCFKGNPAGVFVFDESIEDKHMQLIAMGMNLSKTAIVN